jgi:CDP-glucose 4,6-dehydratase
VTQPDFWTGRPVFVTGSTGLMGGWIARTLCDLGAEVVVLVRDHSPNSMVVREGYIDRMTVVNGSLADAALLRRALSEYTVDTVFHLAAQPLVGVAKLDPVGTLEANVQGTWNLLEACRQAKVGQVVVASSDKAYGASDHLPYRETDALQAEYPYDVSKSCTDLICRMYAKTFGMRVGIARCANLFGGGDYNFSRFLPGLIRATQRGERFVIRSDGKFVRDYLFVKDAVDAYLTLAGALYANPSLAGEAFNFSLEVRLQVLDLVTTVLRLMERTDLEPIIENRVSAEIREQYLDCSKARLVLNWRPDYSLEQGLRETIDWYGGVFGSIAPLESKPVGVGA